MTVDLMHCIAKVDFILEGTIPEVDGKDLAKSGYSL